MVNDAIIATQQTHRLCIRTERKKDPGGHPINGMTVRILICNVPVLSHPSTPRCPYILHVGGLSPDSARETSKREKLFRRL